LTGTQRLLPCTIAGPEGAASVGAAGVTEGEGGTSSAGGSGADAHAASIPTIAARTRDSKDRTMLLILLEALLALAALLFIVWWTMFSGRKKGEPPRPNEGEGNEDANR
jgi:hypothetical protein